MRAGRFPLPRKAEESPEILRGLIPEKHQSGPDQIFVGAIDFLPGFLPFHFTIFVR
jgi:hypothetical protein